MTAPTTWRGLGLVLVVMTAVGCAADGDGAADTHTQIPIDTDVAGPVELVIFQGGAFGPGVDGPLLSSNTGDVPVSAEVVTDAHGPDDTAAYKISVGRSNYGGTPNRGTFALVFNPIVDLAPWRDGWIRFEILAPTDLEYGHDAYALPLTRYGFVPDAAVWKSLAIPIADIAWYGATDRTGEAFFLSIPQDTEVLVSHVRWTAE